MWRITNGIYYAASEWLERPRAGPAVLADHVQHVLRAARADDAGEELVDREEVERQRAWGCIHPCFSMLLLLIAREGKEITGDHWWFVGHHLLGDHRATTRDFTSSLGDGRSRPRAQRLRPGEVGGSSGGGVDGGHCPARPEQRRLVAAAVLLLPGGVRRRGRRRGRPPVLHAADGLGGGEEQQPGLDEGDRAIKPQPHYHL